MKINCYETIQFRLLVAGTIRFAKFLMRVGSKVPNH